MKSLEVYLKVDTNSLKEIKKVYENYGICEHKQKEVDASNEVIGSLCTTLKTGYISAYDESLRNKILFSNSSVL